MNARVIDTMSLPPYDSLERLMLNLKLQYLGHLMWRPDSLEKTLMLGKIEGKRKRGAAEDEMVDGIIHSMDINLSKLQETVEDRVPWHTVVHGVTKRWTQLSNWTTIETILGTHFKCKITKKSTKYKNVALNRPQKDTQYESWNKKAKCYLVWPQLGMCI